MTRSNFPGTKPSSDRRYIQYRIIPLPKSHISLPLPFVFDFGHCREPNKSNHISLVLPSLQGSTGSATASFRPSHSLHSHSAGSEQIPPDYDNSASFILVTFASPLSLSRPLIPIGVFRLDGRAPFAMENVSLSFFARADRAPRVCRHCRSNRLNPPARGERDACRRL